MIQRIKETIKQTIRNRGWDIVRCMTLGRILERHGVDIVIDVGANDGGYVKFLRGEGWNGDISSVEPQPAAFQRLHSACHEDARWKGFHYGLGDKSGDLEMFIHPHDVLSSFLVKLEHGEGAERVLVPVKRLDESFHELTRGRQKPFVKLDTQGFEKAILSGAEGIFDEVAGWQMELSVKPLYEGQPKFHEMIALMESRGFSLWYMLPGLRDPRSLRVHEFDGIFFRDAE